MRMLSARAATCLGLCLSLIVVSGDGAAQSADDSQAAKIILEKADEIRFPRSGFQVEIDVKSSQDGEPLEPRKYRVLSKGNANTVVMVTEPASERGQIILMKDADLWVFLPDVSQPVRLSLSQRLTGQVATFNCALDGFQYHHRRRVGGRAEGAEFAVCFAEASYDIRRRFEFMDVWCEGGNISAFRRASRAENEVVN